MSWFFNPDDWFGPHPRVCLVLSVMLTALAGGAVKEPQPVEQELASLTKRSPSSRASDARLIRLPLPKRTARSPGALINGLVSLKKAKKA